MAYKFNPFTGTLDDVGSGGGGSTSPGGSNTQVQFNDGGAFGGDSGLTFNKTTNLLTVGASTGDGGQAKVFGDINLDDGGSFTTTVQCVTPTANRTISFPDATGTVGLVAGSSGNLVVNQSGAYAGVTNSSVDNATGNITLGSRFISSLNGAASAPPGSFTGTWFTGGTSTTTKPQVLIEPTGTTSTAWSTSGTGLGVNAASGFAGNLLDLQVNGTSVTRVNSSGQIIGALGLSTPALPASGQLNTGFGFRGTVPVVSSSGASLVEFSGGVRLGSAGSVGWTTSGGADAAADLTLFRDTANTLAQRTLGNAQTFRVYGTFTDLSNYVRAALSSTSTAVTLAAESAGTGAANVPINLTAKGTGTVKVNSVAEVAVSSTVAGLPATPVVGMLTRVTDATSPTVGSTVTGGGAAAALVWYNGANWSVIGV